MLNAKTHENFIYWLVTIPFLLWMTFSACGFLVHLQMIVDSRTGQSYPASILIILAILKIIGVVAILQTKYVLLKKISYVGFAINLLGASGALIFSQNKILHVIIPLLVLALLFTSYLYWRKPIDL